MCSAQRWAPAAYLTCAPLPGAVEGAQNPDALANTLDTMASWLAAWCGTWSAEERGVRGPAVLAGAGGLAA